MNNNIKTIRKKRKITQEQLADMIGMQRAVISRYENGIIEPSVSVLKKIAEALHTSVYDLIEEDEEKEGPKNNDDEKTDRYYLLSDAILELKKQLGEKWTMSLFEDDSMELVKKISVNNNPRNTTIDPKIVITYENNNDYSKLDYNQLLQEITVLAYYDASHVVTLAAGAFSSTKQLLKVISIMEEKILHFNPKHSEYINDDDAYLYDAQTWIDLYAPATLNELIPDLTPQQIEILTSAARTMKKQNDENKNGQS